MVRVLASSVVVRDSSAVRQLFFSFLLEPCDVPRLQQKKKKAVGQQRNLGLRVWQIVSLSPGRVRPKTLIGIRCFYAEHAALRSKNKNWLARNQNNVSEWNDVSTCGLFCQCARTKNPTKQVGLEQSRHHLINVSCYRHDMAEKLLIWH